MQFTQRSPQGSREKYTESPVTQRSCGIERGESERIQPGSAKDAESERFSADV